MALTLQVATAEKIGLAEAAGLLNQVWTPPALHYSANYLEWQFGFPPGGQQCVCLTNSQGDLLGFGGFTRRRFHYAGGGRTFYVVSFMAVESALQGMGWGSRLYEALLSVIDGPVLTFARIDSPGASLIEKAYPKAGFRLHRLRDCHLFAGMPSRARSGGDWKLTKDEAADACRGPELISCPDRTEERHWQADPRRRERWRLECEEDKVAADILWQPVRQAGGRIVESVTLERVRVEGNGARGLQALLSRLSGHGDVIQATNLSAIPLEELGKSGWRKIGPGFQCWIAYRETDAFASSTDLPDATNADVV